MAGLPAWSRGHAQAAGDALRSLIEGDSTTRSELDVLGTGSSPSTVTAICCVAVNPPGSVALTETIAAPALTGVSVKVVPETLALTTPTSLETAAYAQVDVFVEQGRHNLGRGPIHESLRTQRVEDLVSFLLAQGTGWGQAGLLMPGRWPPTTIERGSGDPERIARGLYPYVRGQRLGRLHEFVPSSRLNPSSPATFPWTSMIRRAFSSSFSRRVFSRSSLRTFPSSGFRSLGFRPRLFDSALSDPLRTALRHVVRCDEYKPSRRRSRPTSPGSVHRSASSTTRSLYDGLNRRRVGLSTTSASGAAAALRLPSQVSGAFPFSSILSRCLSILGFSAFALL